MSDWGAPDADGVTVRVEFLNPRRKLSGRRYRKSVLGADTSRVTWSKEARELLADLLPAGPQARRWTMLQRLAGPERIELLRQVVSDLVRTGTAVVEERKPRARDWTVQSVEFTELRELRRIAGLPDLVSRATAAAAARSYAPRTPPVTRLIQSVGTLPETLAIRRGALACALDDWIEQGRSGTRRDFALAATGHTKGVPDSDWLWLEQHGALEEAGIVEHEPLLMLAGSWSLHMPGERRLDIGAVPGGLGITPQFVARAESVSGVTHWYLFENRTVFDRAARVDARAGIIWLPGYAPAWWLDVVRSLLRLSPQPATFACDPDPAGIAIVLRAARLWEAQGLGWSVAGMSASALRSLGATLPLSRSDEVLLQSLPETVKNADLAELKQTILAERRKGEQEGFYTMERLSTLMIGNPG